MKAKDLRGKSVEDMSEARADGLEDGSDEQEPSSAKAPAGEEEDAVAAAYENISKKLENIRKGKDSDESEDSKESNDSEEEVELEEWKGPKKPENLDDVEEEEEEAELRRVNLRNLEDEPQKEEELEEKEEEEGLESKADSKSEKDWEPKENDPLDEEGSDESEGVEELEEKEKEDSGVQSGKEAEDEEEESERGEKIVRFESERNFSEGEGQEDSSRKDPQPDSLDDLTEDSSHHSKPMAGGAGDDEEYYIPSLKGSGQREGNLSYNTPPEREGLGQSYTPAGNYMEGNDPNNFFSQHQQPQAAPKRANKFHLLVLVLIGIAVIGFTVYILKGGFGDINIGTATPSPSPSAAATPEPTPTPTPEPEIERGDFTVRVLNGTTTTGLAGKIRDKLKELGYKTATPGNASETDVEQTEIRVKEGTVSATLFERLKLDLAPDYEAKEGDKLDSKATYDAEVTLGAK